MLEKLPRLSVCVNVMARRERQMNGGGGDVWRKLRELREARVCIIDDIAMSTIRETNTGCTWRRIKKQSVDGLRVLFLARRSNDRVATADRSAIWIPLAKLLSWGERARTCLSSVSFSLRCRTQSSEYSVTVLTFLRNSAQCTSSTLLNKEIRR